MRGELETRGGRLETWFWAKGAKVDEVVVTERQTVTVEYAGGVVNGGRRRGVFARWGLVGVGVLSVVVFWVPFIDVWGERSAAWATGEVWDGIRRGEWPLLFALEGIGLAFLAGPAILYFAVRAGWWRLTRVERRAGWIVAGLCALQGMVFTGAMTFQLVMGIYKWPEEVLITGAAALLALLTMALGVVVAVRAARTHEVGMAMCAFLMGSYAAQICWGLWAAAAIAETDWPKWWTGERIGAWMCGVIYVGLVAELVGIGRRRLRG